MLIISKFPKSIAGRTKCSRGLGVWDLCHRHCLATTTFFLDIYLIRLKLHCNGLITTMLSVSVSINDFILTLRWKKSLGQAITIRPVQCYNSCFNLGGLSTQKPPFARGLVRYLNMTYVTSQAYVIKNDDPWQCQIKWARGRTGL